MKTQQHILSPAELTLYNENKLLRECQEEIRCLLNKHNNTEKLSLKGAILFLIEENKTLTKEKYFLYIELKKIRTLLKTSFKEGLELFSKTIDKNYVK